MSSCKQYISCPSTWPIHYHKTDKGFSLLWWPVCILMEGNHLMSKYLNNLQLGPKLTFSHCQKMWKCIHVVKCRCIIIIFVGCHYVEGTLSDSCKLFCRNLNEFTQLDSADFWPFEKNPYNTNMICCPNYPHVYMYPRRLIKCKLPVQYTFKNYNICDVLFLTELMLRVPLRAWRDMSKTAKRQMQSWRGRCLDKYHIFVFLP